LGGKDGGRGRFYTQGHKGRRCIGDNLTNPLYMVFETGSVTFEVKTA